MRKTDGQSLTDRRFSRQQHRCGLREQIAGWVGICVARALLHQREKEGLPVISDRSGTTGSC